MLGLGRALGETIAVLLILAQGQPSSTRRLFSGGETFASKIAGSLAGFGQQPRPVHRRRPRAVRADLHRERARPSDRQPPEGVPMTAVDTSSRHHLRAGVGQAPVQEQPGDGVRVRVLPDRARPAGVGALDRHQQGLSAVLHARWWTETQAQSAQHRPGGGALHAIVGTLEQVGLMHGHLGADRAARRRLPGRVRATGRLAKTTTFMVDILTGIPSIVAALFIYALLCRRCGQNQRTASWSRSPW